MKRKYRFLPWVLLSLLLIAISKVPAETAWQALDILKSQRGAGATSTVTRVRGQQGQDQPAAWEVATAAADGERVYVVQAGRIVADTVYSSGAGVPVDMRRLRVDSAEVFTITNRVATAAKVGFDSVDYELGPSQGGNAPIWVAYLRDSGGRDVGEVEISGEDGTILRQSWYSKTPRIANREPIGPEPTTRRGGLRPTQPASSVATGVGGAAERVKEGFQNVGASFNRIFRGEATYQVNQERRQRRVRSLKRTRD